MKLIAHRGACLEKQEDTLAALELGSEYGAFAVECDPRYTADNVAVIFHDGDLARLTGDPRKVCDLTLEEMRTVLAQSGKTVTTLEELLTTYRGKSAVLFDLPHNALDESLYAMLAAAPFHAIAGVHAVAEAEMARKFFAQEDILAFMPKPDMAEAFAAAGAGNIRLWENWLPENPISEVRKRIPADREIWIMSNDKTVHHPLFCMNGSAESLKKLRDMGAEGVLLNDIAMAMELRRNGVI